MTSTTDTDPDRIIADAEQEAKEAENLVHTLEEKVRSGDDSVTFEEVEKARGLLSFVRLRKEAAKRKAAAATEAARLAACAALNAEITALIKGDGQRFSDQLKAAVEAFRVFRDSVDERNEKVREFRKRAENLGIPEHKHAGPVPATHGGVRLATGGSPGLLAGVVVGRSRVESLDADVFMNRALDLLVREGKLKLMDFIGAGEDLFGDMAAIDAEAPESSAKHFYRGPNGGVFRKDEPFTDEEIQLHNLRVITKAEADAE
ncbi:hypothetical protein [Arthrobacter sp. NPDC058127]|uniref:hypothetical protein n=1 Tax=Arthrobacter sp. NPDC058127 TaxID=3346351 RepID=UPI0036E673F7